MALSKEVFSVKGQTVNTLGLVNDIYVAFFSPPQPFKNVKNTISSEAV